MINLKIVISVFPNTLMRRIVEFTFKNIFLLYFINI